MPDDPLADPRLQALEARLAALVLPETAHRKQELLYHSGFAAGKHAARVTVRRWQASAALLLVLLGASSVPLVRQASWFASREQVARRDDRPAPSPALPEPSRRGVLSPELLTQSNIPAVPDQLTWRGGGRGAGTGTRSSSLATELAAFKRIEPHTRALAMGSLASLTQQP